jgi:DNA (cytosine-5)-methyltransferase 1
VKYLSVCSGIESASLAWGALGWEPVAFSEIEPFPCAVLAHRFGANLPGEPHAMNGVPNWGDMTKWRDWPDADVDVLVGGTPCQSFSIAGLRGGLDDDRGNLALEYCRIAGRYRPRWVVWENVPGVLSSGGGRDFGSILGALGEFGYGLAYRVLDAQYVRVDGLERAVPQRRRRVFVVGYLGDWRRAAAVLFERDSMPGHPPPRREAGPGVAALTSTGVGTCGADDNQAQAGHLVAPDTAPAMTTRTGTGRDGMDEYIVAHALRGEGFGASEDGTGRGTPLVSVFDPNQITSKVNRSTPTPEISHTLPATPNAPVAFSCKDHGADAGAAVSAVRRLTPRECERLQGMPDDWTRVPYRGKPAEDCPDGPRYKAIGNSKAVNVVRWIGRRIEMVEGMI